MKCQYCHNRVSPNAYRCSHCMNQIKNFMPRTPFPNVDMFGATVNIIKPNKEKKMLRDQYVERLKEFIQGNAAYKKRNDDKLLTTLLCSGVCIASMFLSVKIMEFDFFVLGLLVLILGGISSLLLFLKMNSKQRNKTTINSISNKRIHQSQNQYYYTDKVIGFTNFDHDVKIDNSTISYFGHYEVEKNNINAISYDSYFGEYILHLKKPVYVNYDLSPQYEFRIADIFDDTELSFALNCDLPPKYMNF